MHNGKFTSIKSIFSEIIRYPFVEGIQPEDIALYLTNLLSLIGSPFAFDKKLCFDCCSLAELQFENGFGFEEQQHCYLNTSLYRYIII